MQEVEITIEGGVPKVEVKCVKGSECKRLTRELEKKLGEVKSDKPTKEMYEQTRQTNRVGH